MFRDWCPLCGRRFQEETLDELFLQIIDHMEEKNGEKSECEKNFRPPNVVLADDHY